MSIYKKRAKLGNFLKKGEDFKDGDLLEIASEGNTIEGKFGSQDVFLMKTKDGKEGNVSFNGTSTNNMIDAFGEESKNWIGKKVKVWAIRSNVQGKMVNVYYYSHPDAVLNDEGVFELEGSNSDVKNPKKKDIPVIEDDEEVDPADIPF
jgi:hypothetical protein